MKLKLHAFYLIGIVSMFLGALLISCRDDHDPGPVNPYNPPVEDIRQTITAPVALLSTLPPDAYGEALQKATPVRAALGDASVAIVSGGDLRNIDKAALKEFYDKGGIVVVVHPDDQTDDVLRDDLGDYSHPYNDETDALAFAFNKDDRYFIVQARPLVVEHIGDLEELSDEEFKALMNKTDEEEGDDEGALVVDGEEDSGEYREDDRYYYNRIEYLIEWVNDLCEEKNTESRSLFTRADAGTPPPVELTKFYGSAKYSFDIQLRHQLEKASSSKSDSLLGKAYILASFKEYPLYVFDIPGQGESVGEYYIVEGTLEARSDSAWNPKSCTHGGCVSRLVGYYLESLQMQATLVNANNSDKELDRISFYNGPYPETSTGSSTYTDGFSTEVNGTLTGKLSGKPGSKEGVGIEVDLSVGFKCTWSHTRTQTIQDITAKLDKSRTATVGYTFDIQNIINEKKWGNWIRRYPLSCRSTISPAMWWIWKLPAGSNDIRNDHEHEPFYMKVTLGAKYGAYSWWRGGSKGHEHHFEMKSEPIWKALESPSHASFGIVALHNAGKLPVANITIFNEKGSVVVPDSYSHDQYARQAVKTGTYTVTYDLVDTENDNRLVSKWQIDNVVVKIGNDPASSTTVKSTANAKKIKDY